MKASIKPVLSLWGEGGDKKGMGHIMRLISIARFLNELPIRIRFILLEEDKGALSYLESLGYNIELYPYKELVYKQIINGDIVVIDGYTFKEDVLFNLKERGSKIIYIDDMQHVNLSNADIVINHTPGYTRSDFQIGEETKLFLGSDYCMLRPQFIENQSERQVKELNNMVVSLGMSNSGDALNELVNKLNVAFPNTFKYIIAGPNKIVHSNLNSFNKICDVMDADEVSKLFRKCDIAVFPLSTLYLEGLASGLIMMAGYFVENQRIVYKKLMSQNVIWGLGNFNALTIDSLRTIKTRIESDLPITNNTNFGSGWINIKRKIEEWL